MNRPTARLTVLAVVLAAGSGCDLRVAELGGLPPLPASPVPAMEGWSFSALDAGSGERICGVTGGADVACWTMDLWGAQPVVVVSLPEPIRDVATSSYSHDCVLALDGTAYCWGENWNGQLGDGTRTARSAPVEVAGGHAFTRIAVAGAGSCGITVEQTLYCWGDVSLTGSDPECPGCGRSDTVPVQVEGGPYTHVTLSTFHGCAIAVGGEGLCWGDNYQGQGGTGTGGFLAAPTPVQFDGAWTDLSAGADYTCGLDDVGNLYCWGRTFRFDDPPRMSPVAITTGLPSASIHAGPDAACILDHDGAAYCWGTNAAGRLGTAHDHHVDVPEPVQGGLAFSTVVLSHTFTCGLEAGTGTLHCSGEYTEP